MHQISIDIPDEAYDLAAERARQEGFGSPEGYLADFIANNIADETENYDHRFTPEVVEHLDRIVAKIDAGEKTLSREQVEERLAQSKAAWLENHVS